MEALGQYIVSVVAAAILCGVLRSMVQPGLVGNLLRLVSGVFLAYTVLSPISAFRLDSISLDALPETEAAIQAAQAGAAAGEEAMAQIIKQQTQAYILEKAKSLGAELEAEVFLDEENLPQKVIYRGSLSPSQRRQLQSTIAQDLGIPKENQQWIPSS